MDRFSVNYQGMAEAVQTEQQLSERLSDLASRLASCNAKALAIGSLRDKGYHRKIYQISSSVGNRQSDVYRMSQGLMKVCDAYRSYELQVLQQAEEIITVKNGFSRKMTRQVKSTVKSYEKQVEKNRFVEEKTFGSLLYDGTVGQWKENWVNCKEAVLGIKELRKDIGEYWAENFYGFLEEHGVDGVALGGVKFVMDKTVGALDSFLDSSENIVLGVVDIPNPESVKDGVVTVFSGMTKDTSLEGIDKVMEGTLETLMPGSEVRMEYESMTAKVKEAFESGNYLKGAEMYLTGSAKVFGQGIADAGANVAGKWADDFVKDASQLLTGEEATLVEALNGGESLLNDFAGWMYGMRG